MKKRNYGILLTVIIVLISVVILVMMNAPNSEDVANNEDTTNNGDVANNEDATSNGDVTNEDNAESDILEETDEWLSGVVVNNDLVTVSELPQELQSEVYFTTTYKPFLEACKIDTEATFYTMFSLDYPEIQDEGISVDFTFMIDDLVEPGDYAYILQYLPEDAWKLVGEGLLDDELTVKGVFEVESQAVAIMLLEKEAVDSQDETSE